ncbi:DUF5615 family PIN-like protein [Frankia sp. Cas3]|uniref:DUF5615 family PIN-like protein n=1 Tax=Frankia sp. Cas3 TaxID=3073926 RepID=UPI002AD53500|nr:DUF5615 family PIN-like protein [Frankia sp. Cas3]
MNDQDDPSGDGPRAIALLLDEMHAPAVAQRLRDLGHDVVAVAADDSLRAMADADLYAWALEHSRWIVTENVKDFRRLLVAADEAGGQMIGMIYTSNRTFPRTRRNHEPLVTALDAWLRRTTLDNAALEEWLRPA